MNETKSLLVLATKTGSAGWRLGGVRTRTISDKGSIDIAIESAVKNGDVGIIAVPETMRGSVSRRTLDLFAKTAFPILIFYPDLRGETE